jgi:Endosomal/lysosomal potassium channel TMEM175
VPDDQDTPRGRQFLGTDQLAAFSDGVFAIAATLLVLDIAVHPPGTPLQQVLHAWPAYLAYVVSFLTIGAAWLVHTALTGRLARSDPIFLQIKLARSARSGVPAVPDPARRRSPEQRGSRAGGGHVLRADPAGHPPPRVRPGCLCPARAPVLAASACGTTGSG